MILSDGTLNDALHTGHIRIDPLGAQAIQPSSIDVHLDRTFRTFDARRYPDIDVRIHQPNLTQTVEVEDGDPFTLHPGQFVLAATLEHITIPADLVARLEGKSSLGRLGLTIHSTAGFVDPGFDGHLTLELSNVAPLPTRIWPGMKIGQLAFFQLDRPAVRPYGADGVGSKYQGQRGPTPSRFYLNYAKPPE